MGTVHSELINITERQLTLHMKCAATKRGAPKTWIGVEAVRAVHIVQACQDGKAAG